MVPVFCFTAFSGTGKTTYIEKLISELRDRGLRVGAVKYDGHDNFEVDKKGKDSWRFGQAGAEVVAVCSGSRAAIMSYRPLTLDDVLANMQNVDLVISEGFRAGEENNITIYRAASGNGMKLDPADCIAVVSDTPLDTGETPVFPLDNVVPMADFITKRI